MNEDVAVTVIMTIGLIICWLSILFGAIETSYKIVLLIWLAYTTVKVYSEIIK